MRSAEQSPIEGYSPTHLTFAGMSQAVRSGDFVMLSGQVALDDAGKVSTDDPYEQAVQSLRNIEAALALAGAGPDRITKLVCYLVDADHYPAYSRAKATVFPGIEPAGTTVVVSALLDPRMLIEVEAWAYLGDATR